MVAQVFYMEGITVTRKQAMEQVKIQAEACKKLRAWITGYEQGSGFKVLNGDNLRLLILSIEELERSK